MIAQSNEDVSMKAESSEKVPMFRKHKYSAKKVEASASTDGYSFGSKLEAAVYQLLKYREIEGSINNLQTQKHVLICGSEGHECNHKMKIESVVDFCFIDTKTGQICYAEAKGFPSPQWPIKLRLWRHYRTEPLEIWKGSWQRPYLDEVIN